MEPKEVYQGVSCPKCGCEWAGMRKDQQGRLRMTANNMQVMVMICPHCGKRIHFGERGGRIAPEIIDVK